MSISSDFLLIFFDKVTGPETCS